MNVERKEFTLRIPDGVKAIEYGAFLMCKSLQEVVLGNGIKKIDGVAFDSCRKLKSITIPKSVTQIGENAFQYCGSLTINIEADSIPKTWDLDWNPDERPVKFINKP